MAERLGWNIAKQEVHQSHRQKHKQKKRAEASLDDLCGVDFCVVPIARDNDHGGDHEPNQASQGNSPSRGGGNEHGDKVLCSCHNLSLWHKCDFFANLCRSALCDWSQFLLENVSLDDTILLVAEVAEW